MSSELNVELQQSNTEEPNRWSDPAGGGGPALLQKIRFGLASFFSRRAHLADSPVSPVSPGGERSDSDLAAQAPVRDESLSSSSLTNPGSSGEGKADEDRSPQSGETDRDVLLSLRFY